MDVDTSIAHHFPRAALRPVLLAGFFLLLMAIALWVLIWDGGNGYRREASLKLCSVLFLAYSPLALASVIRAFANSKKPEVEVSDAGILDRRFLIEPLPWHSIKNVAIGKRGLFRLKHLSLSFQDRRQISSCQSVDQRVDHFLRTLGRPIFELRSQGLQSSHSVLSSVVEAFWDKHKSREAKEIAESTN